MSPGIPLRTPTATDLDRQLERLEDTNARTTIGQLHLAAVSQHCYWFAACSQDAVSAVGTTPGAAASLKIAVARAQGRKPEDALYRLVADPEPIGQRLLQRRGLS